MKTDWEFFVVCAPGLEALTAQELLDKGLKPLAKPLVAIKDEVGGVAFRGDLAALYRANLQLRTASRVLARLGEFHALGFPELRRKISLLPWENFLRPGQPVALRVTCHKSKLYHSDAVAERVADGIADHLGQRLTHGAGHEDETSAAQLIVVRFDHDHCTVSVDASGALLHQRGYRQATGKAPLRETLAAAMLLASGWDKRSPLLDPFCGSGTIAIEAALMARNIAPGHARRFAFMDWPGYDEALWKKLLAEEMTTRVEARPPLVASDRDAGAIAAAQANAARAGVAEGIDFSRRAVSAIEPPAERGWVISNLPYGARTQSNHDLRNLYARCGQILREQCAGWQVALLIGDEHLQSSLGLPFDEGRSRWWVNGGLRVKLVRARVPEKKMKDEV